MLKVSSLSTGGNRLQNEQVGVLVFEGAKGVLYLSVKVGKFLHFVFFIAIQTSLYPKVADDLTQSLTVRLAPRAF